MKPSKKTQSFSQYLDAANKKTFSDRVIALFGARTSNNDEIYEQLLVLLIQADVGVNASEEIISRLRDTVSREFAPSQQYIIDTLARIMEEYYVDRPMSDPSLIMIVGVNGSGKTTSIAKLARYYSVQGKSVGLIAGDTFRAGAVSQLEKWAEKLNIPIVTGKAKADPSSVLVDGCRYYKDHPVDIIIADTAGRMQNRGALMKELEKMVRVTRRESGNENPEIWLTLDATIGQNSLSQAEGFLASSKLTGIILTKMDGTSKGGIVLAVNHEFGLPVRFMTFGENLEAIAEFDIHDYIETLVKG